MIECPECGGTDICRVFAITGLVWEEQQEDGTWEDSGNRDEDRNLTNEYTCNECQCEFKVPT